MCVQTKQITFKTFISHVRGVKSEIFHILCTKQFEQNIKAYIKGDERDSKYTVRAVVLCVLNGILGK